MFSDLRGCEGSEGKGREREGENQSVASLRCRQGDEPATFWCKGGRFNQLSHQARAEVQL